MAHVTIKDYTAGAALGLMTGLASLAMGQSPDYTWTWWEAAFDLHAALSIFIGGMCLRQINKLLDKELAEGIRRTECTQEKPTSKG